MSWNHRVLRQDHGDAGATYAIHEVFYDDEGNPYAWTAEPVPVYGDTWIETVDSHAIMGRAFALPVLEIVGERLVERTER